MLAPERNNVSDPQPGVAQKENEGPNLPLPALWVVGIDLRRRAADRLRPVWPYSWVTLSSGVKNKDLNLILESFLRATRHHNGNVPGMAFVMRSIGGLRSEGELGRLRRQQRELSRPRHKPRVAGLGESRVFLARF